MPQTVLQVGDKLACLCQCDRRSCSAIADLEGWCDSISAKHGKQSVDKR
jgi:hypothetical protein